MLAQPFEVAGKRIEVGASVGVALSPMHGKNAGTLLRRADVAMYAAKRNGGGSVVFREELEGDTSRLDLISELKEAPVKNQLRLVYQPQIDLKTGQLWGVEALIRWDHPRDGSVHPDRFIPLAEQSGIIRCLDFWAIQTGMRQCREWCERGRGIRVSVNVSARSLQDRDFADSVSRLLAETGVDPHCITLEVTESAVMEDLDRAIATLARLHEMGLGISIDDFGTGYSSLSYLMKLPADEVKIDRSFVRTMASHQEAAMIVRLVTDLGHNLRLRVVAEGVEDQQTLERLAVLGCDLAQGYHIGRPQSADRLEAWLESLLHPAQQEEVPSDHAPENGKEPASVGLAALGDTVSGVWRVPLE